VYFPESECSGRVTVSPNLFVTGERATVQLIFTVGEDGITVGGRLRWGLPNTGWEQPVVPQQRYWDELVSGADRRVAPFHPVNTTAEVRSAGNARIVLSTMERMLVPNEDPAEAYWRWWITATVEDAALAPGDEIAMTYGDYRFTKQKARVQTFPEDDLTYSIYVDVRNDGTWTRPAGAPVALDVKSGSATRANVVLPSTFESGQSSVPVRVALTDECHCAPEGSLPGRLGLRRLPGDGADILTMAFSDGGRADGAIDVWSEIDDDSDVRVLETLSAWGALDGPSEWGRTNPCVVVDPGEEHLYWGDLHAQSEYHVMHSQKKDSRQVGWSKGISCGTPDDVYRYARDVSLLDFVAITDQGANTGTGWQILQEKAIEYYRAGEFVTFKSYEAGSPVGHRNVYYRGDEIEPTQTTTTFNYMPETLYSHYRGRKDVILVPHHVKAWTDWQYHDPDLEPIMEIYSCWGQSEDPSLELWNKGMTPGAGAWEALARGYRLGMIASSDNHVGMPGRSYPHDRQVHTPFPGGLAAIWAPELTREALFDALRNRRCYGTTGARIVLRFSINGEPMGSMLDADVGKSAREIEIEVAGTGSLAKVELIRDGRLSTVWQGRYGSTKRFLWTDPEVLNDSPHSYYVRIYEEDGQRAWSSPIWIG
jgi:hypothetical protein